MPLSLTEVADLAARAHAGQVDLIGAPYTEHLRAVADALAPFGTELQMAGWLHDILEDTPWTAGDLRAEGVPAAVVAVVERVTRTPDRGEYLDMVRDVATDPLATLVKIADNAHNSRADRAAALDEGRRARLAERYGQARHILWSATARADVEKILERVNPDLLAELAEEGDRPASRP